MFWKQKRRAWLLPAISAAGLALGLLASIALSSSQLLGVYLKIEILRLAGADFQI